MADLRFDELWPDRGEDVTQAARFARALWGKMPPQAWASLVLMRGLPVGGRSVSCRMLFGEDRAGTRWLDTLDEYLWRQAETEGLDVYAAVGTTRDRVTRVSAKPRGSEIGWLPGVWMDLDAKDGSFADGAEIDKALHGGDLPEPTMTVDSGSGGRHAYWLLSRPVLVDETMQRLAKGWIGWAQTRLCVGLDQVGNTDRILRVPGTIRHPRKSYGPQEPRLVRIVTEDGPRYSKTRLWDLVEWWWLEAEEAAERRRSEREAYRLAHGVPGEVYVSVIESVAVRMDWSDILEPAGWQLHHTVDDGGSDEYGVRYWTRPGKQIAHGYSATTDFQGSYRMSLYTSAPECGLAHLESPITKFEAYVALHHGGDEIAAIEALRKGQMA